MAGPNPATVYPVRGYNRLCFLRNIIASDNIEVGEYTYYDDFNDINNFHENVKYHFDFIGDKLIIGKFCMIASGVRFIMNGGNHLTNAFSTYPFAIFQEGWGHAMDGKSYPYKGNTVIGNDVWIGHNVLIMPGVTLGDGAIIGTNATVVQDVPPYTIVGGNPAVELRKRFSEKITEKLQELSWWHLDIAVITDLIPLLTSNNEEELLRFVPPSGD